MLFRSAATFGHIGVESMGPPHTWYHFVREVGLDLGVITGMLIILFAAPRYRTPVTWWVALVLMIGYYLPYWAGIPFNPALAPPGGLGGGADWNHYIQAAFPLAGLFLGRRHFFGAAGQAAMQHSAARA